jgi:hypothetical protein
MTKHHIITMIVFARDCKDGMGLDAAIASTKGYYKKTIAQLKEISKQDNIARRLVG